MKWTTQIINIDLETGEQISNKIRKQQYNIIKKIKTTTHNETSGTVTITNECRKSRQTKLWTK